MRNSALRHDLYDLLECFIPIPTTHTESNLEFLKPLQTYSTTSGRPRHRDLVALVTLSIESNLKPTVQSTLWTTHSLNKTASEYDGIIFTRVTASDE